MMKDVVLVMCEKCNRTSTQPVQVPVILHIEKAGDSANNICKDCGGILTNLSDIAKG